jgi:multicomponent Na+:H+ antiporter subunit G
MSAIEIIATVLLALGSLVMFAAAIGVLRFPDFYTRLHAAGKGDTLGQGLILLGLAVSAGTGWVSFKLLLIILFIFIFNPTSTHALARGAWVFGLKPWTSEQESAPSEPLDDGEAPE